MRVFFVLLNNRRVKQEEEDKLFWKGDKKGTYTVMANTVLLEGNLGRTMPWLMLWNNCVPPKVCFFAWEIWWGKTLTMENLKKRGFQMATRCPLYGKAEEDLHHL